MIDKEKYGTYIFLQYKLSELNNLKELSSEFEHNPNVLRYFSALELFFVNQIGLPFNSGSIIAGILLVASFYYGLKYTRAKKLYDVNTGILCLLFILIGS